MSAKAELHGSEIPKLGKPGRKRVRKSPYAKKALSSDARIILALMKKQPQLKKGLLKKARISKTAFYEDMPLLVSVGIVKETEKGYALHGHDDREEAVVQAISARCSHFFGYVKTLPRNTPIPDECLWVL